MPVTTLTSKGQVTIPKTIRDRLSLKVGDRLIFGLDESGGITVQRAQRAGTATIEGLLRHLSGKRPLTLARMRDAVRQRAAHKHAGTGKR